MFYNKEIDTFVKNHIFKLSDWFESKDIVKDGAFTSTQPVDTDNPYSICFCESLQYVNMINENLSATCVITTKALKDKFKKRLGVVVCQQPRLKFHMFHNSLAKKVFQKPVFTSCIRDSAEIHPTAFVEKHCYIGENVVIGHGAIILDNSYIENNVVIGPNVVIGTEGLEFKRHNDNKLIKILHIGGVYLGSGVEIKANSVVCKDVYFGYTQVGTGTKIGPLCNIAHRSRIGKDCMIAGNATVGGSAKIGNSVWLGPSATISSGISVGDYARVSLGSVVVKNVKAAQTVSGFFALDHSRALREFAFLTSKGD